MTAGGERAELIDWLVGQGITVEEIEQSFAPMLLAARRALGDDGTYVSARQISEEVGLDLDQLIRFQRAAGMAYDEDPDAPVFMRPDADGAVHIKRFLDLGIDPDRMLSAVRVLAEGLAHAAEEMRGAALGAVLHPGATELEIAQASQALVSVGAPLLGPMIQDMLLLQLRHTLQAEAVNASERAAGVPLPGARMVAAAFADLVGFTRLGEELAPEELERLANRLADLARDVAVPPVRFIKTIGDAVMFVSPDTAALVAAVLALIEATAADETLPRLRVGVAYGAAVSRAGDWFGGTINLASRITSAARPGSVLVAESACDQIAEDDLFHLTPAGAKHFKGISGVVKVFRVRSALAQDGHAAGDQRGDQ